MAALPLHGSILALAATRQPRRITCAQIGADTVLLANPILVRSFGNRTCWRCFGDHYISASSQEKLNPTPQLTRPRGGLFQCAVRWGHEDQSISPIRRCIRIPLRGRRGVSLVLLGLEWLQCIYGRLYLAVLHIFDRGIIEAE